jgi:hypothetical protein
MVPGRFDEHERRWPALQIDPLDPLGEVVVWKADAGQGRVVTAHVAAHGRVE